MTAVFEALPTYSLTTSTSGNGKGSITGIKKPIIGYTSIVELLLPGTSVTLTAVPMSGSVFTGWSGACSGTGNCTVVMNGDKVVSAGFAAKVSGTCGATTNTCTTGIFADVADSTTQYLWSCNGLYGGTNVSCSKNKPLYTVKATKI